MRRLLILTVVLGGVGPIFAQTLSSQDRDRALSLVSAPDRSGNASSLRCECHNADLIMSDGKNLENTGVVPDKVSWPGADDLRTGKDTVLARAVAAAVGISIR